MKIYDIISESVILNENISLFRTALTQILQRGEAAGVSVGSSGIMAAIEALVRRFTTSSSTAKELAEYWAATAKFTGMEADDAIALGVRTSTAQGVDAAVIEAAKKQAARLIGRLPGRSKFSQLFAKVKNAKEGLGVWYMGSTQLYINVVYLFGIAEPIYEAVTNIAKAYEEADKGNAQYKDNIQYIVQWEITNCTKKVLGIMAGKFVTKHLFGTVVQGLPFMGGPTMGKLWNTLGQAGQAVFVTWFQTAAGQEAFAKWLVGELLIPGTDWHLPGGGMFNEVAESAAGWAKTGYDAILRQLDHRYAGQPTENPLEKPGRWQVPQKRFDPMTGAPVDGGGYWKADSVKPEKSN